MSNLKMINSQKCLSVLKEFLEAEHLSDDFMAKRRAAGLALSHLSSIIVDDSDPGKTDDPIVTGQEELNNPNCNDCGWNTEAIF